MRKVLLSAIAVALIASVAPMAQASNKTVVAAWACPLPVDAAEKDDTLPLKPKKDSPTDAHCGATIPEFPGEGEVTSVQGKIYRYGVAVPPTINKRALSKGASLGYSELSCADGHASGTLNIGGVGYDFTYERVGPVAVISAVGPGGDRVIGVVTFLPKELDPTSGDFDPVKFLVGRCITGDEAADDLKINFYGGGVHIDPSKA